ncbi:MAG: alpha/beta hydrolase, partial [Clostridia bacterium]|nr:alpha/beta hydrolase [Clostridia bacterium]
MKDKTKKIIGGTTLAAAGLAGLIAASHSITRYLMRVALDRREPKSMKKAREQMMGAKENEELVTMLRAAADALEAKVTEEVEITSHDGIRLVGHWWPCDDPKRVVVAMHGWRSSWSQDFGVIADFWHDNGCSILFAEQRGQNRSGGDYMGFGLMERCDCRDWIGWVNDETNEELPIYLGGVSMGATTVLMTAGLELPQNVVGIVADCAFTSPYAIWKHIVEDNLHLSYGIRSAAADDLCERRINMKAREYTTTEALKNTDIPVLF